MPKVFPTTLHRSQQASQITWMIRAQRWTWIYLNYIASSIWWNPVTYSNVWVIANGSCSEPLHIEPTIICTLVYPNLGSGCFNKALWVQVYVLFEYFNRALHLNIWASLIWTIQFSEQGFRYRWSTVLHTNYAYQPEQWKMESNFLHFKTLFIYVLY